MTLKELLELKKDIDDDYIIIDKEGNGVENNFHAEGIDNFFKEELNATVKSFDTYEYGLIIELNEYIYKDDYMLDVFNREGF